MPYNLNKQHEENNLTIIYMSKKYESFIKITKKKMYAKNFGKNASNVIKSACFTSFTH